MEFYVSFSVVSLVIVGFTKSFANKFSLIWDFEMTVLFNIIASTAFFIV